MTAMPQMVALFNGVGGGAVALIAWVEFRHSDGFADEPTYVAIFSLFAAIVGSVSFWGSNIAFGKLQEILPGRPIIDRPGRTQQLLNLALLAGRGGAARWRSSAGSDAEILMIALLLAAAVLGNFVVLPIGGADMPVVISLLNAFTGLSAAATGVALNNTALIVAGMIVGASRLDPDQPHGPGHEPLDPVDRRGRLRRRHHHGRHRPRTASSASCARPAPRTPPSRWPTPTAWSSSPATAWRSPRPSTPCAR